MSRKAAAWLFLAILSTLTVLVFHFLKEMGWQFALGVMFGACVYQLGYYCKTGKSY